jgi:hypothetical protein
LAKAIPSGPAGRDQAAGRGFSGGAAARERPGLLRLQRLYERLAAGPWDAVLEPRAAWFLPGPKVKLESAGGSLACEPVSPYPPGVPVVWPGERILPEHIELLKAILELGGSVQGLYPGSPAGKTGWLVRVAAERGA